MTLPSEVSLKFDNSFDISDKFPPGREPPPVWLNNNGGGFESQKVSPFGSHSDQSLDLDDTSQIFLELSLRQKRFPVLLNDCRRFVSGLKNFLETFSGRVTSPVFLNDDRGRRPLPVVEDVDESFPVSGHSPTTLKHDGGTVATFDLNLFDLSGIRSFRQEPWSINESRLFNFCEFLIYKELDKVVQKWFRRKPSEWKNGLTRTSK